MRRLFEAVRQLTGKYDRELTDSVKQFAKADKEQKPFTSIKYKRVMAAGKDYEINFWKYNADGSLKSISSGSTIPVISANATGAFRLEITGKGSYSGTIAKDIYVGDKSSLMKNAKITLGKNIKSMKYTGSEITLQAGSDYTVSYADNKKTGSAAVMTIK